VSGADLLAQKLVSGDFELEDMSRTLKDMAARGETPEEVIALVRAFRQAALPVPTRHKAVLDLCGTGGSSVKTFNVSTIASFVVAAQGVPVAKHGGRSNAGKCGSADLIEALGAKLAVDPAQAGRMLDETGFAFLFAPAFHPAMRNVAQLRKTVRSRTAFNLLGPLLNPVQTERRQIIGVYSHKLLKLLPPVLEATGVSKAMLVHGRPGMDEIAVSERTLVMRVEDGSFREDIIDPVKLGLHHPRTAELADQPPAVAARVCREVLEGELGARRDMVLLCSAYGLMTYGAADDVHSALAKCEAAIDSGRALRKLDQFLEFNRSLGGDAA